MFKRKISVDDHYLFTVTDMIENQGKAPVSFFPDASVTRQGLPKTSGYSVLHEGFIGVIGADQPSTEITYKAIAKETNSAKVLPAELLRDRRLARLHRQILGDGGHSRRDREIQGLVPRIPGRAAAISSQTRSATPRPWRPALKWS